MRLRYILEGKEPVPCEDLEQWAEWFEKADRTVKKDTINGYQISTVFISIDHRFTDEGEPIVFETGVFGVHSGYDHLVVTSRLSNS
ncbi:MAG: hypothetical protein AB8G86_01845 [Saprospiraceae bacterium]